jgi:hypothetical protein
MTAPRACLVPPYATTRTTMWPHPPPSTHWQDDNAVASFFHMQRQRPRPSLDLSSSSHCLAHPVIRATWHLAFTASLSRCRSPTPHRRPSPSPPLYATLLPRHPLMPSLIHPPFRRGHVPSPSPPLHATSPHRHPLAPSPAHHLPFVLPHHPCHTHHLVWHLALSSLSRCHSPTSLSCRLAHSGMRATLPTLTLTSLLCRLATLASPHAARRPSPHHFLLRCCSPTPHHTGALPPHPCPLPGPPSCISLTSPSHKCASH